MKERIGFQREMAALGLKDHPGQKEAETPPAPRVPRVMFEFDVHYGFRAEIDAGLNQQVPGDVRLTKHDHTHDFFNVKRDLDRMEIGTGTLRSRRRRPGQHREREDQHQALRRRAGSGRTRRDDAHPSEDPGRERKSAPLPAPSSTHPVRGDSRTQVASEQEVPHEELVGVGVSQAHMTIPLSKVGALITAIEKSADKAPGEALTGKGARRRMGLKSDHLYKAKKAVESLRGAMLTWNHKLKNGVLVDRNAFTDQLADT